MKAEWMPMNPCGGCINLNGGCLKDMCSQWQTYTREVTSQRDLLEYQIALCRKGDDSQQGNGEATIGVRGLVSMLVQLEGIWNDY